MHLFISAIGNGSKTLDKYNIVVNQLFQKNVIKVYFLCLICYEQVWLDLDIKQVITNLVIRTVSVRVCKTTGSDYKQCNNMIIYIQCIIIIYITLFVCLHESEVSPG